MVMEKDYRSLLVCVNIVMEKDYRSLLVGVSMVMEKDCISLLVGVSMVMERDYRSLLVCVSMVMEKDYRSLLMCEYGDGKGLQSFTGGCQYDDALSLGDSASLSRWGTLRQGRHNDDLIRAEKESSIIISPLKVRQGSWHEWWRTVATVGIHPQQPRCTDKTLGTEIMISLYGC